MDIQISIDDARANRALQRIVDNALDLTGMMEDFAFLGENAARQAFETETAPDGTVWKQSRRSQETGGKTLTASGRGGDSITSDYDNNSSIWGTPLIYMAIHQNGGTIKPKNGEYLVFMGADGFLVFAKEVTIPKRQFLPESLDQMDEKAIRDIVEAHLL